MRESFISILKARFLPGLVGGTLLGVLHALHVVLTSRLGLGPAGILGVLVADLFVGGLIGGVAVVLSVALLRRRLSGESYVLMGFSAPWAILLMAAFLGSPDRFGMHFHILAAHAMSTRSRPPPLS